VALVWGFVLEVLEVQFGLEGSKEMMDRGWNGYI
jgi:hypothetical protein